MEKSQPSTVGVLPQLDRVVSLYCSQSYAYSGSYKRGKIHSCAIPYSRTFYAYMHSRCPGSDKPPSSSQPSPAGIEYLAGHLQVLHVARTSFWLLLGLPSDTSSSPPSTSSCSEAVRCSSPEILIIYGARSTRAPYRVAPEPQVESQNQAEGHFSLFTSLFSKKIEK